MLLTPLPITYWLTVYCGNCSGDSGVKRCLNIRTEELRGQPIGRNLYNNDRMIGLMYQHSAEKMLAAATVFVELCRQ